MGYTPLFDSLVRGTLCGKWPDIGLWPVLLALADKNGEIDATPTYLASITGLEADEIQACLDRFCGPDPLSRSAEAGGARLVLLDPARPWGWRVVNHRKYREQARLAAKNAREVETGKNKDRLKDRRSPPATAADRRSPPPTPSQTQTHTQTEEKRGASALDYGQVENLNLEAWELWQAFRREQGFGKYKTLATAKKLATYPAAIQLATITESIEQCWQGLFPEKVSAQSSKISAAGSLYDQQTERLRDWLRSGPNP